MNDVLFTISNSPFLISLTKNTLLEISSTYERITRTIVLDKTDERIISEYDFWGIENNGGTFHWIKMN